MNAKVLIVYPYTNIDTNPTMSSLLQTLVARGYEADVLCSNGDIELRQEASQSLDLDPARRQSLINPMTCNRRYRLFRQLRLLAARNEYSVVVGVDPDGLVMAHRLSKRLRCPLAYISFELMFREELFFQGDIETKQRELDASKDVSLVLVQDEERGEALAVENDFSQDLLVFVPNSPPPQAVPSSDYLRKKLGIAPEKRIVLYTGTIDTWTSRDLFKDIVHSWPDQFTLVIHGRAKSNPRESAFLSNLEKSDQIIISSEPLPGKQLAELYASADFGLAPYRPTPDHWTTGRNIHHMGLASGKVAYYAMCGLPVIANLLPVYKRSFADYDMGATFEYASEAGECLSRLNGNYEHHSAEAKRFYQERLDPMPAIGEFIERLSALR